MAKERERERNRKTKGITPRSITKGSKARLLPSEGGEGTLLGTEI